MIEFFQENMAVILGGGGVGAVVGGIVGVLMSGRAGANRLNEATLSEVRSMIGSLSRIKDELNLTQKGFSGIIDLLNPGQHNPLSFSATGVVTADTASSNGAGKSAGNIETNLAGANVKTGLDLAEKLLGAVMAIPALPKIPDFARDFEMVNDNPMLSAIFKQLNGLDTDDVNTMIGEFKSLVETTLKPGLERARNDGIDFILEPDTIATLTKGAGSFIKSIGGMTGVLDLVLGRLKDVVDQFSR